ncbi:hypothetical protein [Bythopirellula polymerisocia]|nr:hypothetical protein [Bythopirellula polymerisocia]
MRFQTTFANLAITTDQLQAGQAHERSFGVQPQARKKALEIPSIL